MRPVSRQLTEQWNNSSSSWEDVSPAAHREERCWVLVFLSLVKMFLHLTWWMCYWDWISRRLRVNCFQTLELTATLNLVNLIMSTEHNPKYDVYDSEEVHAQIIVESIWSLHMYFACRHRLKWAFIVDLHGLQRKKHFCWLYDQIFFQEVPGRAAWKILVRRSGGWWVLPSAKFIVSKWSVYLSECCELNVRWFVL